MGHTAEFDLRMLCGGGLIATDSTLSRPYRAYGNLYCPSERLRGSDASLRTPRRGSGCDQSFSEACEGQILEMRLDPSGAWIPTSIDMQHRTNVTIDHGLLTQEALDLWTQHSYLIPQRFWDGVQAVWEHWYLRPLRRAFCRNGSRDNPCNPQ